MIFKITLYGICLLPILMGKCAKAQDLLSGFVGNSSTRQPLFGVSVSVIDLRTNNILHYTTTDEEGIYNLILPVDTVFIGLNFNALGYSRQSRVLTSEERTNGVVDHVFLEEHVFRMDEVLIHSQPPFRRVGDTLVFPVEVYRKGDERVAADLLKRLPGFEVAEDGTIRVGNQQIEKVMVDGDDFFHKAYPIMTNSLPAFPIAEVQVLKNYSEKALLRGIEKSDKVVLNLKLSEAYQNVWFGNVMSGLGLRERIAYDVKSEAMNFSKKNKYVFLIDLNNTGRSASAWADLLMDVESNNSILSNNFSGLIEPFNPEVNLEQDGRGQKSRFQRAETISLNNIINLSTDWKVKTISFLNRNLTQLSEWTYEQILDPLIGYDRQEEIYHAWSTQYGILQFQVAGELRERSSLTFLTNFHAIQQDMNVSGLVNIHEFEEVEKNVPLGLSHSFEYINRWSDQEVFLFEGQFKWGKSRKSYKREELALQQKDQFHHEALSVKYIRRPNSTKRWTLEIGGFHNMNEFNFPSLQPDSLGMPNYQHAIQWTNRMQTFQWVSQLQYLKNIGRLDLQWRLKTIQNLSGNASSKKLRFNPGASLGWSFNSDHKIQLGYSYSHLNHHPSEFNSNYARSDFRSAIRGVSKPNLSEMSTMILNHLYNDWSKGLYIHSMGYLVYFHKSLSTRTQLTPWFNWSDRFWISGPFIFNFQSGVDYFIEPVSSNIKLKFLWNRSRTYFQLNSNYLKEYLQLSYQYELELRSAFSGIFNFHFGAKKRIVHLLNQSNPDQQVVSHESFLDFQIKPQENWKITSELEWYYSYYSDLDYSHQFFLNSSIQYQFKQSGAFVSLVGKNLLGEKYWNHFQLHEYVLSQQKQLLVPRKILLRFSCRI